MLKRLLLNCCSLLTIGKLKKILHSNIDSIGDFEVRFDSNKKNQVPLIVSYNASHSVVALKERTQKI